MDYNTAKGQLRKAQTDELKALQKEMKKSKPGAKKEAVELRIKEAEERHELELKELASKHGVEEKHTAAAAVASVAPAAAGSEEQIFGVRDWSSLGKKELIEECERRGVSKSGSKEDLVTRLTLFTQSQEVRIRDARTGAVKVATGLESDDDDNNQVDGASKRTDAAAAAAKKPKGFYQEIPEIDRSVTGTGRRPGGGRGKMRKPWKRGGGRGGGRGAGGRRQASSDEDGEVEGGGKWSKKGKKKNESDEEDNDSDDDDDDSSSEESEVDEEEMRRRKRRQVMYKVMTEVMKRNEGGVHLDELPGQLKALKVANFRPELLGFESIEEWLVAMPPSVLVFDTETQRLQHPGSSSDDDEDDDEDDDDESDE